MNKTPADSAEYQPLSEYLTAAKKLYRLREYVLQEEKSLAYYVPPHGQVFSAQESSQPLLSLVKNKFSQDSLRVFLLKGQGGTGKSTFASELIRDLWKDPEWIKWQPDDKPPKAPVPLLIPLSSSQVDPKHLLNYLQNLPSPLESFTEKEIQVLTSNFQWLLIADGYDELPKEKRLNLYDVNDLAKFKGQFKLLITSRFSEGAEKYDSGQFVPHSKESGALQWNEFFEIYMTPFSEEQITVFLAQYIQKNKHRKDSVIWSEVSHYQREFKRMPELKNIISIPFLLMITAEVLPQIVSEVEAGDEKPGKNRQILTQAKLYHQYMQQWFDRQANKAIEAEDFLQESVQILGKEVEQLSKLTSGKQLAAELLKLAYKRFCQYLAVHLQKEGIVRIQYPSLIIGAGLLEEDEEEQKGAQMAWVEQLFSINAQDLERILKGCPLLKDALNNYQFLHTSLIDFFVMSVIVEQSVIQKSITDKEKKYEPIGSKGLLDEDDEQDYILQNLLPRNTLRLSADSLKQDSESSRALNRFYAGLIQRSKTDPGVVIGAANAISILNAAGENFSSRDYSNIRIPGADLSGALLDQTLFIGADLTKVSFRGAWLYQTNFDSANMTDIDFGEKIFLSLEEKIQCLDFSPISRLLAVVYEFSQMIRICDVVNNEFKSVLQGHLDQVTTLAWNKSGTRLASSSDDCTVRIWDVVARKECGPKIEFSQKIKDIIWDGEGKRIACLEQKNNNIVIYHIESRQLLARWMGGEEEIQSIAWNSQKNLIAIGSDGRVRLWNVESKELIDFNGYHERHIYLWPNLIKKEEEYRGFRNSYLFSAAEQKLLFIDQEGTAQELKTENTQVFVEIKALEKINPTKPLQQQVAKGKMFVFWEAIEKNDGHKHDKDRIQSLSWNSQGTRLASTNGKTIGVWEMGVGQEICRIPHGGFSLAWDPYGERLAAMSEGTIDIWKATTGKLLHQFEGGGSSVTWDNDGEHLISIGRTIRSLNVNAEKELRPLNKSAFIESATWEPKGRRMALGSTQGEVIIADTLTGEQLEHFPLVKEEITALQWSPRGGYQVAILPSKSLSRDLLIYDLATQQQVKKFSLDYVESFDWHWDGYKERLAIGNHYKNSIQIWDTERQEKVQDIVIKDDKLDFSHPWAGGRVTWNPQGTCLAALSSYWVSMDHNVVIWKLGRKHPYRELSGHVAHVSVVAWNKEGKKIATAGYDLDLGGHFEIRVWDIATGKNIHEFKGHQSSIHSLVWDEQGLKLLSGSRDCTARIWNLVNGECLSVLTYPGEVKQVSWQQNDIGSIITVIFLGGIACYQWDNQQNKTHLRWLNSHGPLLFLQGAHVKSAKLSPESVKYLSQYVGVIGAKPTADALMSTAERQFYLGEENHPADEDYILGMSYLRGYGTLIDNHKAYKYIRAAAQKNHPRAIYSLAWMYANHPIFSLKGDEGSAESQFQKSFSIYYKLFLTNATVEQAITKLDAWACFALGSLHLLKISDYKVEQYGSSFWRNMLSNSKKLYQAAIPLLKQAAENKVLHAQYLLGLCYQWGIGIENDSKEAVHYYQLAADSGYAFAQSCLASCYENGVGVAGNLEQALFWYEQAAVQNELWSQKMIMHLKPDPLDDKIESTFLESRKENLKQKEIYGEPLISEGSGELRFVSLQQFILYEHNILASWPVALKWLENTQAKIAEVLKFCAYLHYKGIEKYFLAELMKMSLADMTTGMQTLESFDLLEKGRDNKNILSRSIFPILQFGIRQWEAKHMAKEQIFKSRLQPLAKHCLKEIKMYSKDTEDKNILQANKFHFNAILYHLSEFVQYLDFTESITMEAALYTLQLYSLLDTGNFNTYYEKLSEKNLLADAKSAQKAVILRKRLNDERSILGKDFQNYYIKWLIDGKKLKLFQSSLRVIEQFKASIYEDEEKSTEKSDASLEQEKIFKALLPPEEIKTLAKQLREAKDFEVQRSAYYDLIVQSKTDESKAIAAANAITLLNVAGENFSYKDFQGVHIPGADLSGGLLEQVRFNKADLRNVCFQDAWAVGADFQGANLTEATFNEQDCYEMDKDSQIAWDLSPDGKTLAVIAMGKDFSRVIKLYDAHTRQLRFWFGENILMNGITISWDKAGKRLAVGCNDGHIIVWEASSGQKVQDLTGHRNCVYSVSWHPHEALLASAGQDKTVRVWDLQKQSQILEFQEHKQEVCAVAWDPTGKQLASGSKDNKAFIIQTNNGKILQNYSCEGEVHALVWDFKGQRLITGAKKIQVWSIAEQKELPGFESKNIDRSKVYKQLVWDSASNRLVACTTKSLEVWDIEKRQLLGELAGWLDMGSMAYWSEEEKVAVGEHRFSDKHRIDIVKLHRVLRSRGDDLNRVDFIVSEPSGKQFAFAGPHDTILVFDSDTLQCSDLCGHLFNVIALAWDPKGKRLVSAGADSTIRLWDLEKRQELAWFTGHTSPVKSLSWNSHGDRLLSVTIENEIWLWDINTQQCYAQLLMKDVVQVVWDPSGTRLIGCNRFGDNKFWVLDVVTGHLLVQFGKDFLKDMFSISPQAEQIAIVSGYRERDIQIVNFNGQRLNKITEAHHQKITCLIWDQEGERLVSGDNKGLVKIWQIQNQVCLSTLSVPQEVTCLHFLASEKGPLLMIAFANNVACYLLTKDYKSSQLQWLLGEKTFDFFKYAKFNSATGLTQSDKNLLIGKGVVGLTTSFCQIMQLAEKQFFLGDHKHAADQDYLQGIVFRRGFGAAVDNKQAAQYFHIAAQKGHCRAKYYFAYYCQDGVHTSKDEPLAQQYFLEFYTEIRQQVSEKADAWAYYILADLYENGCGIEKDEKQAQASYGLALPLMQIKAEQGILQAQTWLGTYYEFGKGGVEKNAHEALRWYSLAVAKEFSYAQLLIGNYYERDVLGDNLEKAIYWYQLAASKGEAFAASRLKELLSEKPKTLDEKSTMVEEKLSLPSQPLLTATKNAYLTSSWLRVLANGLERLQTDSAAPPLLSILLRDSVNAGIPQALTLLGLCYERGLGMEKNEDKAIDYYDKALNKKEAYAQLYFGDCYYKMSEIKENREKSFHFYRLAAQQGEVEAQIKLAVGLVEEIKPDFDEAFFWFQSAAEQSHVQGRLHVGLCYEYGLGVTADAKTAFNHYQLAVEGNDAVALSILGFCYERGVGVDLDSKQAISCYKKAARQGYWVAISRLNDLGEEFKYDSNRAWIMPFSKNYNSTLLNSKIGEILFGLNPQKILPEKFSGAAGLFGHVHCFLAMKCWNYALEIKGDKGFATHLFQMAALMGDSFAQVELGLRYEEGEGGVLKDSKQAVHWYRLAAEQGNAKGQYNLADCYARGFGIDKNSHQALLLYKKAAVQGHAEAKNELKKLRKIITQPLVISSIVTNAVLNQKDLRQAIYEALAIDDSDDFSDPSIAIGLSAIEGAEMVKKQFSDYDEKPQSVSSVPIVSASSSSISPTSSKLPVGQSGPNIPIGLKNVVASDIGGNSSSVTSSLTTPLLRNEQGGRTDQYDSLLSDSSVNLFPKRSTGRVVLPIEPDYKPEESCCGKCIIF